MSKKREYAGIVNTQINDRSRLAENMPRAMRLKLFLPSAVFDFIAVLIVAVALSFTVTYGFKSGWDVRNNIALIAFMSALVLLPMYWGTWSKKVIVPAVVAWISVAAIIFIVANLVSDSSVPALVDGYILNDETGNYRIFALIVVLCATFVFLLSRKSYLLVFLMVATIGSCALIQYLYRDWIISQIGLLATIIALIGFAALFVYQSYRQSVYSANRIKHTSFAGAYAYAALIGIVGVLFSVGIFYGLINGLGLMTPDVRFFSEPRTPPIQEANWDFEKNQVTNDELSNNTIDSEQEVNDSGAGQSPSEGAYSEGVSADGSTSGSPLDGLTDLAQQIGSAITGMSPEDSNIDPFVIMAWGLVFMVLALVLCVVLIVLARRYWRSVRLKIVGRKSGAFEVWYLYNFFLSRWKRLGIKKSASLTAMEFAYAYEEAMMPFTIGTDGVTFIDISSLYQDVCFGGYMPTDEDLSLLRGYYRAFFKNAFRITPVWRWAFWRFWRI